MATLCVDESGMPSLEASVESGITGFAADRFPGLDDSLIGKEVVWHEPFWNEFGTTVGKGTTEVEAEAEARCTGTEYNSGL